MKRGFNLSLAALAVAGLCVTGALAFTPSISPIPDIILGDLTPNDNNLTPGDTLTRPGSVVEGNDDDVFEFPDAINIFDLVQDTSDTPGAVAGFTSDENLIYEFRASAFNPPAGGANPGDDRIGINGQRIASTFTNVSSAVAASPDLTFKDLAYSTDEDATALPSIGQVTYPFGPGTYPGRTGDRYDVTADLVDWVVMEMRVTNTQGNPATAEFQVVSVNEGPDSLSRAGLLVEDIPVSLTDWVDYNPFSAVATLEDPTRTKVADADGDGSGSDLQIDIGDATGTSYCYWQSPAGFLPYVDNGTYRLDWRVSDNSSPGASEFGPTIRLRWGYNLQATLGGGEAQYSQRFVPFGTGQNMSLIFDQLAVASATGQVQSVDENAITLYFESLDFETNLVGQVELDDLDIQRLDRDAIIALGTLEEEVQNDWTTKGGIDAPFTTTDTDIISVTLAAERATITAVAGNGNSTTQFEGIDLFLGLGGAGLSPFAPADTSGKFYRAVADLEGIGSSTVTTPLPRIDVSMATFEGTAQRLGTYATVLGVSLPGTPSNVVNPALSADTFATYLVLPEGTDLATGSDIGTAINAAVRLVDETDVQQGTVTVESIVVSSYPESLLP